MKIGSILDAYSGINKAIAASLVCLALLAMVLKAYAFAGFSFVIALVWILLIAKSTSPKKNRHKSMLGAIQDADHAHTIIKSVSSGFYILLGLRLLISVPMALVGTGNWYIVVESLVLLFIVYEIRVNRSRKGAFLLGAFLLVSLIVNFIYALIEGSSAGVSASIGINLLLLWYAIRAEKAISYLDKNNTEDLKRAGNIS